MKILPYKPLPCLLLTASLALSTVTCKAAATIYLSNLDNFWPGGGIGDIHSLFPGGVPYGSDTAHFATGSGLGFSLNAVTLEFLSAGGSHSWDNVDIQLFEQPSNLLLGSFGNPVNNPKLTQWPSYTTFIDFSPNQSIELEPFTEYSLVISVPATSGTGANLLFTQSSSYTTPASWRMDVTTSGNPYAYGEYLVMAVNATLVPEPHTAVLVAGGCILLIGFRYLLGAGAWRRQRPEVREGVLHVATL